MDRISAIRNVEDALRAFENGEADLADTERRVAAVLRTYATEFDGDGGVFRAVGDEPVDGRVVVAPSAPAARERVLALSKADASDAEGSDSSNSPTNDENGSVIEFEVERVTESE
ncbi:hypothetical protein ACFQMF_00950 [Halorubrum rutilum]|uniref:Amphi-Trp domain-containing protein n=1 Tax=Halorubrum rutilum TaxID=1364933 RepID=A0ABD6AFW5_9EURY|nr:hypothetical protein [Halorubrum rutilum]